MKTEFEQAVALTPCGSLVCNLYKQAEEIVADYIENSIEADELFYKALSVIEFIKDGESAKALEIDLNA